MIAVKELQRWLATLQDGAMVFVDEGGICLVADSDDAYIEVGGFPYDDEGDDDGIG